MDGNMLPQTNHQKFFKGDLVVYHSSNVGNVLCQIVEADFSHGQWRYYAKGVDDIVSAFAEGKDLTLLTTYLDFKPPMPLALMHV